MKRHLRPWVQTTLIITGLILFIDIWTYNNCTAEGLPRFALSATLFFAIAIILGKWGKH